MRLYTVSNYEEVVDDLISGIPRHYNSSISAHFSRSVVVNDGNNGYITNDSIIINEQVSTSRH